MILLQILCFIKFKNIITCKIKATPAPEHTPDLDDITYVCENNTIVQYASPLKRSSV